ncbi:MAG: YbaB/EbfC family nucleoid-associated protein [Opitutae bacterium]|nr:YbaB/EbfC family nucleoid-associated protein [Opitutae bacterium]
MAGVGKLLKQAQKMQRSIEEMQKSLETRELDISSGGGAVQVKINGSGKFLALKLDPEFLKEDAKLVEETILNAVQEAATKAKELNDSEMQRISSAFQVPGMF